MRFKDRVAIVTGAGRNIGESLAKLFAAEGAKIVAVDMDEGRGKKIADEITKDRQVVRDDDGAVHAIDPVGYGIAFRASRRIAVEAEKQEINTPGAAGRIDKRARVYDKAAPIHLSHMVIAVPNPEETRRCAVARPGLNPAGTTPMSAALPSICSCPSGLHSPSPRRSAATTPKSTSCPCVSPADRLTEGNTFSVSITTVVARSCQPELGDSPWTSSAGPR